MKFITDSRTLLNSLPPLTGDAARLGHRLSQSLDRLTEGAEIAQEARDMLAGNPSPEAIDTARAMLAGLIDKARD